MRHCGQYLLYLFGAIEPESCADSAHLDELAGALFAVDFLLAGIGELLASGLLFRRRIRLSPPSRPGGTVVGARWRTLVHVG